MPTQASPAQITAKLDADIEALRHGSRTMEVAHKRDFEHYERLKRRYSLAVLVLTTLTGTGAVTSLATDTNIVSKAVVAGLAALAALAAALNDKGPYGDEAKAHQTAAGAYNALQRSVGVLDRDWKTGKVDGDAAAKTLGELETKYDGLEADAPDLRSYPGAHDWVIADELQSAFLAELKHRAAAPAPPQADAAAENGHAHGWLRDHLLGEKR